jgi:hypothetical protein
MSSGDIQTDSAAGIPLLLSALDDADPQVAFAVMQGLGNLTQNYSGCQNQRNWMRWFRCLNHWREYRQYWNHGK